MKIIKKGNATQIIADRRESLLTNEKKSSFFEKFLENYPKFKGDNIILDISEMKNTEIEEILLFSSLIKNHKKEGKSFVIVSGQKEMIDVDEHIFVTPTLKEATDVIELEDIERDLGI